jgi:hypothetical protein
MKSKHKRALVVGYIVDYWWWTVKKRKNTRRNAFDRNHRMICLPSRLRVFYNG